MFRLITIIPFFITTYTASAQTNNSGLDQQLNEGLRSNDKMTAVIAILGVIFLLISAYLIYQDIRLKKLEKDIQNNQTPK